MANVTTFDFNASFTDASSGGFFEIDFTTNTLVYGAFDGGGAPFTGLTYSNGVYTLTGEGLEHYNYVRSISVTFAGQDPASFQSGTFSTSSTQATETGSLVSSTIAIVPNPTCFATGTLICTARGDVAVEDLRVGDNAVTVSGALRPITWVGYRHLAGQGRGLPHDQQPIRIRADAFAPGMPCRDLFLSPGHPVFVGADADHEAGVLVPVMCLINGTSIARASVERITYWHVELDSHDILLAEALPAESYIDLGSRRWFDGADSLLYDPDLALAGQPGRCRPVVLDGPIVEVERRRLDAVFTTTLAAHCAWHEADAFDWLAV